MKDKDDTLHDLAKFAEIARQHGATDDEIRQAVRLGLPYALPGLTHDGQRGAEGRGNVAKSQPSIWNPDNPAGVIDILRRKREFKVTEHWLEDAEKESPDDRR
jgi:hypothetical protein